MALISKKTPRYGYAMTESRDSVFITDTVNKGDCIVLTKDIVNLLYSELNQK